MKLQKLGILAVTLALALVFAACNGDDDIAGDVPDVGDDDVEQVDDTTTVADDVAGDDAIEEYADDEDPDVADDTNAVTDAGDEAATDQETVDVTVTDDGIQIVLADAAASMTEEDDAVMDDQEEAVTDEEDDIDAADDEAAIDEGEDEELLDDQVTFSSGNILFNVTNDWDREFSLAIEPEGADTNGAEVQAHDQIIGEGDSTEWEVNLEPGDYVMYVVVDGEPDMEMQVQFTVDANGETNDVDEADDIEEEEDIDPADDEENDEVVEGDAEADDA